MAGLTNQMDRKCYTIALMCCRQAGHWAAGNGLEGRRSGLTVWVPTLQ